jgi:hypothetical protein
MLQKVSAAKYASFCKERRLSVVLNKSSGLVFVPRKPRIEDKKKIQQLSFKSLLKHLVVVSNDGVRSYFAISLAIKLTFVIIRGSHADLKFCLIL